MEKRTKENPSPKTGIFLTRTYHVVHQKDVASNISDNSLGGGISFRSCCLVYERLCSDAVSALLASFDTVLGSDSARLRDH